MDMAKDFRELTSRDISAALDAAREGDGLHASFAGIDLRGAQLDREIVLGADFRGALLGYHPGTGTSTRGIGYVQDLSLLDGAIVSVALGRVHVDRTKTVEVVLDLKAENLATVEERVARLVTKKPELLNMNTWHHDYTLDNPERALANPELIHTCDTTHCMAGWASHLLGETGYALEYLTGHDSEIVGSRLMPSLRDHFFSDEETALALCQGIVDRIDAEKVG